MAEMTALMRMIWRNRLSSAAGVAVLAVSIAGASTTFALIDAVLWRALPYCDPTRLMVLLTSSAAGQGTFRFPTSPAYGKGYEAVSHPAHRRRR